MSVRSRWISRSLIALCGAAALYAGAAAQTPAARAHVHASSDNAVRGAMAIVTFQVPNESNTESLTTALTITLPNVSSARTESLPGWTAKLDRDAASGTVRSVTWTATLNGGIGPDQFGLFRLSVKLPDTDTVSFPAAQTYADGTVVNWNQQPLPDGSEPEHPVPTLSLAATPAHQQHGPPNPAPAAARSTAADNTARLLGGAALVVAAAGVAIAMARRRA
ncbi:nuclear export factor GLE1 [Mycobacterium sp. 852002-51971_SCH5477799-a]|uniref:YcnI family protein n=1 Tax=Mycobacterium sp. 852002-51971_SCH5477799-a TaxID=1834106 RepID=UPI000800C42F|nr:YcnI family protein [Mycobacterium sp. 852002-51971_SCH5477799-a]OBF63103.1 nuclear export factor GLE1 [Mycobacterium sp. 852002-51971_SCH5477799-a]